MRPQLVIATLAVLASLALFGADTSPFPAPVVIVYPLTGTGGTPPDVGGNVAILLSTKLAQLGGITVKPYTPGTQRPQYLQAALDANADYYITGYLTPVGDDVSMIMQVVSTHSGSVAFSSTAVVRTYGDIVGQADTLREAILRHAGRGFPAVEEPAPGPTGSAAPSGNEGGVNLSKALGHHRGKAAATATPSGIALGPSASPAPGASPPASRPSGRVALAAPHGGALVAQFDGAGTLEQRAHAQTSLAAALYKVGIRGGAVPIVSSDAVKSARPLCTATPGSKVVITGALSFVSGAIGAQLVEVDTVAYDCNGAPIGKQTAMESTTRHGGIDGAIDRASATVAAALAKLFASTAGNV